MSAVRRLHHKIKKLFLIEQKIVGRKMALNDIEWQSLPLVAEWHLMTKDKLGFGLTPSIGLDRIK